MKSLQQTIQESLQINEGRVIAKGLQIHKSDKEKVEEIIKDLDDPSSKYDGPQGFLVDSEDENYVEIQFASEDDYEEIYKAIKNAFRGPNVKKITIKNR